MEVPDVGVPQPGQYGAAHPVRNGWGTPPKSTGQGHPSLPPPPTPTRRQQQSEYCPTRRAVCLLRSLRRTFLNQHFRLRLLFESNFTKITEVFSSIFRHTVRKYEKAQGFKKSYIAQIRRKQKIPEVSYPLPKPNNNQCRVLLAEES